jgi:hypothetical protein
MSTIERIPDRHRFQASLTAEDHLRFGGEIMATRYVEHPKGRAQLYLVRSYSDWAVWYEPPQSSCYARFFQSEAEALAFYACPPQAFEREA